MNIIYLPIKNFIVLATVSFFIMLAYVLELAETNAYMGYAELVIDYNYIVTVVLAVGLVSCVLALNAGKPSNYFSIIFSLFVLLPYSVLHAIRGPLSFLDFVWMFLILIIPLAFVGCIARFSIARRLPAIIDEEWMIKAVVIITLIGILFALLNPPASAGFSLESVYDRRIEGRDIFVGGSLQAYLNSMVVNGFAPFLAFYSGWLKRFWLIIVSILSVLVFFYLLGLKAPFFYTILAYIFGYAARRNILEKFPKFLIAILMVIFVLFLIEYLLLGSSVINDLLIRRLFTIPPYLISAYYEFIVTTDSWYFLSGSPINQSIAFEVGEIFLGYPGLNANTNTFIYQLAGNGFFMYIAVTFLVMIIYYLLDSSYKVTGHPVYLYLAFSFSLLIAEQSATTTLISSGIGLLLVGALFVKIKSPSR